MRSAGISCHLQEIQGGSTSVINSMHYPLTYDLFALLLINFFAHCSDISLEKSGIPPNKQTY